MRYRGFNVCAGGESLSMGVSGLSPVDGGRRYAGTGAVRRTVMLMLAVIMLVLGVGVTTGVLTANTGSNVAVAADDDNTSNDNFFNNLFCGSDLGWNTRYLWFQLPTFDDGLYTSKWTIKDLYANSLQWTVYNGTKSPKSLESDDIFPVGHVPRSDAIRTYMVSAANEVHTAGKCLGNGITSMVASMVLWVANMVSNVSSFFVTQAVNPKIICPTASGGSGCINLLKVLAGDGIAGGSTGIIGHLYSGLYLGLLTLAFACVGVWMLWTGIVKYKTRTALNGFLWALGIMFIGCMIGGNPMLVAQAPMKLGTGLGGCVIMAMNGVNCLDSNSTSNGGESGKRSECYVDSSSNIDWSQSMALYAKMTTCDIWRAFVLQPWSLGQFGRSYDELYFDGTDVASNDNTNILTLLPDDVKSDIQKEMSNARVSLSSTGTDDDGINPMTNCKNSQLSDKSYRNLALYQLDLMSSLHDCTGYQVDYDSDSGLHTWTPLAASDRSNIAKHSSAKLRDDPFTYADWLYMIELMSANRATAGSGNDDNSAVWYWWSGQNSGSRFQVAFSAVFCSICGAVILITTSVLAIMYLFSSVIMTVFAPLFLLFGIVPGQGKKIFLGYLEEVVGAILKYFACILYMMVVIEVYGSVLGTDMSLGSTVMFVTIFTIALWSYRRIFINLIGKANLGGQKLSEAAGGAMGGPGGPRGRRRGPGIGQRTKAIGAAALGGAIAAKATGADIGATVRNSMWQEAGRGSGIGAQAARAREGIRRNNVANIQQTLDNSAKDAAEAQQHIAEHISSTYGADASQLHNAADVSDFVEVKHADELAELDARKSAMDDVMNAHDDKQEALKAELDDENTTDERRQQIQDYQRYNENLEKIRTEKDASKRADLRAENARLEENHAAVSNEVLDEMKSAAGKYDNYDLAGDEETRRNMEALANGDTTAKQKIEKTRDDASDAKRQLKTDMNTEKNSLRQSMTAFANADRMRKIAENNAASFKEHKDEYGVREMNKLIDSVGKDAINMNDMKENVKSSFDTGKKFDASDNKANDRRAEKTRKATESMNDYSRSQRKVLDTDSEKNHTHSMYDNGHTGKDDYSQQGKNAGRPKPQRRHRIDPPTAF